MFASLSNNAAASDFASSVLPTPVGPRNKNDPIGFVGSLIPAFERMMESLTNCTATSCPTTRLCNSSPRCKVLLRSLSVSFATGIPVHFATIFAISSSVTHSCTRLLSFSLTCASRRSNSCLICGSLPYCSSAAFSRLYSRCATWIWLFTSSNSSLSFRTRSTSCFSCSHVAFICLDCSRSSSNSFRSTSRRSWLRWSVSFLSAASSISRCMIFLEISSNSAGIESSSVLIIAHASSTRSIALSGRKRSVI